MFLLNFLLYSLNCPSCGDVIYGISYLCSFSCPSRGDVICGTFVVYMVAYNPISTIVSIVDGSTLPLIIFYAFALMLSCSLFVLKLKVPPPSTLLFLLITFLGESTTTSFLFSNVVYISTLVLLTLVDGLFGFSF